MLAECELDVKVQCYSCLLATAQWLNQYASLIVKKEEPMLPWFLPLLCSHPLQCCSVIFYEMVYRLIFYYVLDSPISGTPLCNSSNPPSNPGCSLISVCDG